MFLRINLLIAISLFLVGCGPKFKVGDCVQDKSHEPWQDRTIRQILIVGKQKYLYRFNSFGFKEILENEENFALFEADQEIVPCPKEFLK